VWGQRDSHLLKGCHPISFWNGWEVAKDRYDLAIRPDLPLGEYQIEVRMYFVAMGRARLRIFRDEWGVDDESY